MKTYYSELQKYYIKEAITESLVLQNDFPQNYSETDGLKWLKSKPQQTSMKTVMNIGSTKSKIILMHFGISVFADQCTTSKRYSWNSELLTPFKKRNSG